MFRFWNNDVFENLDGVLETLLEYVAFPSPCSLSRWEREQG
ncbi:MAG TPA: hypothetical protein EYQ82_05680 [Dehalococcoidia bacterium]|nr:hypothetical protein [Dehalococcoidia bacterium]